MTPWAAKCSACCDEPHWRSMVVAGTDSGHPAASTMFRPTLNACSPTWDTQPMMTSSTILGSRLFRLASARSASDARSTACQFFSFPLRFPPGVRTASTMTACGMRLLPCGRTHVANPTGKPRSIVASVDAPSKNMDRWLGDGGMALLAAVGVTFERYGVDGEDLGWVEGVFLPRDLAANPHGSVQAG